LSGIVRGSETQPRRGVSWSKTEASMGKLRRRLLVSAIGIIVGLLATTPAHAADCPKDSVRAGTVCIDKYEASVWLIQPQGNALSKDQQNVVDSIRNGSVTLTELNKVGAVQLGLLGGPQLTPYCPLTGNECTSVYAVSIAGIQPSGNVTWFQAAAAARNSFKRLPTNAEWTAAAFGTPDDPSTNCNMFGAPGGTDRQHRFARRMCFRHRCVRHGGQRFRVGRGLGAAIGSAR
jgi:hypothetical protein